MMARRFPSQIGWIALALLLGGCGLPRWPVQAEMTSAFGVRFQGIWPGIHHGVDLRVPTGTPVHAVLDGRVRFAGEMSGYGQVIWLEHARGTVTVYAHLSQLQVQAGDRVRRNQQIGLSGATGQVTAPHLHFEVWKGGRPVDPVQFLGRRPGPIRH
jgi:murein DD-endopeptidase MepM/ murein hydrolase activator NlpD